MEIFSFTGKSGTGKSYSANRICRMNHIDGIIDDGLLIYKGAIVAGRSAKESKSKAVAMRRALFNYEDHRLEVMEKLRELNPHRLMVIGTSDRIEDYTSAEQRELARDRRMNAGEHAIPVPMGQLKRNFAGYILNPSRFFRNRALQEQSEETSDEKERTVVRPPFSYIGKFEISEQAIRNMITIAGESHRNCIRVLNFYHNGNVSNFNVVVEVKVRKIPGVGRHCSMLQQEVGHILQEMTSFSVGHINIQIRDVSLHRRESHPGTHKNRRK